MAEVPFRAVCKLDDVPDGAGITVELDGSELAVFRIGESLWCTEGRCPHAFELMSKGVLENGTVECLAHHYVFDLKTGKATQPTPGAAWLKLFPIQVVNGEIRVAFEGGDDEW
jgi:3-phenylpropionate/trans-cinnamate dioxygenase ferredoxin component